MRKVFLVFLVLIIAACSTNPITGKKPLILVNKKDLFPMAFQQYDQILKEEKLSTNQEQIQTLNRVGNNIKATVERFLASQNQLHFLDGYEWEFSLIENPQLNAWCMPGGKVAFYTGIMPVCQNEDGIAVVMGHEITHAIAEHSAQRMTQSMIAQGLQDVGNIALNDSRYQNVFNQLYPVGANLGILAYSRSAELEADKIGLQLMAMSGYDPREAPRFWERMMAQSSGQTPPEFLSTHPNPGNRIAQLNAEIPKVLPLYHEAIGKK